jgi:hypothetical protein
MEITIYIQSQSVSKGGDIDSVVGRIDSTIYGVPGQEQDARKR